MENALMIDKRTQSLVENCMLSEEILSDLTCFFTIFSTLEMPCFLLLQIGQPFPATRFATEVCHSCPHSLQNHHTRLLEPCVICVGNIFVFFVGCH